MSVVTFFPSSQESYAMLHKHELSVAKEEVDKVDTLRYTWEKLLSRTVEVQNELAALQPHFRGELVSNVKTFQEDCQHFYQDYEKVKIILIWKNLIHFQLNNSLKTDDKNIFSLLQDGPMVEGLAPQDASDRLIMFQVNTVKNTFQINCFIYFYFFFFYSGNKIVLYLL